jgi:hypothetical protein
MLNSYDAIYDAQDQHLDKLYLFGDPQARKKMEIGNNVEVK